MLKAGPDILGISFQPPRRTTLFGFEPGRPRHFFQSKGQFERHLHEAGIAGKATDRAKRGGSDRGGRKPAIHPVQGVLRFRAEL
jgi:hypothetical protein